MHEEKRKKREKIFKHREKQRKTEISNIINKE